MKVVGFTTIINVAVSDDLQYAANNNNKKKLKKMGRFVQANE